MLFLRDILVYNPCECKKSKNMKDVEQFRPGESVNESGRSDVGSYYAGNENEPCLPIEIAHVETYSVMVGDTGIEPVTSAV